MRIIEKNFKEAARLTSELKTAQQSLDELDASIAALERSVPTLEEAVVAARLRLAELRNQLADKERLQGSGQRRRFCAKAGCPDVGATLAHVHTCHSRGRAGLGGAPPVAAQGGAIDVRIEATLGVAAPVSTYADERLHRFGNWWLPCLAASATAS